MDDQGIQEVYSTALVVRRILLCGLAVSPHSLLTRFHVLYFYEEDERVDTMFQECAPVSPPVYGRPHAVFSLRGILHPHAHGTSPTPTAA
jgi:hypothetical protein